MKKSIPTSLGFPLFEREDHFEIDLTNLRIFTGLSVLARILGDMILDHVQNSIGDVSILYKINYNINPEVTLMHIQYVQIYARSGVLDNILLFRDEFQDHLRSVFGTFQRPNWAVQIHPEFYGSDSNLNPPKALIFPFHHVTQNEAIDYQFVLERVENKREVGQFLLRLTIESIEEATLHLSRIPHTIVDDLKQRVYLEGTSKLSENLSDRIQIAIKKGSNQYTEENLVSNHIFEQLEKTKLGKIEQLVFFWDSIFAKEFIQQNQISSATFIKKIFLSLEDNTICNLLKEKKVISILLDKHKVYIYLTRLSRVLNFSINKPKVSTNLDTFLNKMPILRKFSLESTTNLKGIRVFLIHHITSEILATIQALKNLQVDELNVMFVKYGGIVPSVYLEAILEIEDKGFFTAGITKETNENSDEYFVISKAYSDCSNYLQLNNYMASKKRDFFEAMKFISGHFFLKFIFKAVEEKSKVILVEDGGYLAPLWNQYIFNQKSLKEVCEEFLIDMPENLEKISFRDWILQALVGSVEHTRNGYDRLLKVKTQYSLNFPTYSIALSKEKTIEESKEVAHSILSAVESVLHGLGLVLSRRKIAVLGAEGNIGKFLCKYLESGRLREENSNLLKIDIKYNTNTTDCYPDLESMPIEKLLEIDIFLGVIGESILTEKFLEKIILLSHKEKIFFISGSTKTLEFKHLSEWIKKLQHTHNLGGIQIQTNIKRILDPQSGIDQGGIFEIYSLDPSQPFHRSLYLLADLTPINFLFYGVPTEMMDSILTQLVKMTTLLKYGLDTNTLPKSGLYALDVDIDERGNLL